MTTVHRNPPFNDPEKGDHFATLQQGMSMAITATILKSAFKHNADHAILQSPALANCWSENGKVNAISWNQCGIQRPF
jgi:hypothetical protein